MMGQGYGTRYQQPQKPVAKSGCSVDAPRLRVTELQLESGTVQDDGDSFEADVTAKDGPLVNKLFVTRTLAGIRSEY